jgi:hypothetical protein
VAGAQPGRLPSGCLGLPERPVEHVWVEGLGRRWVQHEHALARRASGQRLLGHQTGDLAAPDAPLQVVH